MRRFGRPVRVFVVALAAAGAGVALGGCGGGGSPSMSIVACNNVHRSIATYQASLRTTDPAKRSAEQQLAKRQLGEALMPAAAAANGDDRWGYLMSNIFEIESPGVPEGDLISSLQEECARDLGTTGSSGAS